ALGALSLRDALPIWARSAGFLGVVLGVWLRLAHWHTVGFWPVFTAADWFRGRWLGRGRSGRRRRVRVGCRSGLFFLRLLCFLRLDRKSTRLNSSHVK